MTGKARDEHGRETSQSADRVGQVLFAVARRGPSNLADLVRDTGIERRALGRLLVT